MARQQKIYKGKQHLATSIGHSKNTKIKNKHKRKNRKPYKGQGK